MRILSYFALTILSSLAACALFSYMMLDEAIRTEEATAYILFQGYCKNDPQALCKNDP